MSAGKKSSVAVVVTYNRKELLKQNIECLLKQTSPCDIYIIDNASTDGTGEMVKSYTDERIHYFNTGANLGGAGGFEYGVGKAARGSYDYIWMMDDDTLPKSTALEELFKVDKKLSGNWGWLSSVAYWTDGSICRMNIQKKDIFRHIGEREYKSEYASIKMCSFVSLLVKTDVVKELGLPIGDYFIWTDDYEFTGRISRKYPCYMVPGSKVVHAMKTHIRVDFAHDSADRIDRYHYIYRNDVHCYRQYGVAGWAYIILKDCYTSAKVLLKSPSDKAKKIGVIIKGFKEGLRYNPLISQVQSEMGGYSEDY